MMPARPMATRKPQTRSPESTLKAVRRFSRINGWSVAVIAGLGTLISLLFGDLVGVSVGLLAVAAGAMEIHGQRRLSRRDADGMKWLVRSQLGLLSVVLVYAVSRLASFDRETAMGNLTPDMAVALKEAGIDTADLLPLVKLAFFGFYGAVILVTCVYQGGLALYYRSRVDRVTQALAAAPNAATTAARGPAIDQRFYDQVAAEMSANQVRPGLWTRALAESGGEDSRCKALYIRLRVEELQRGGIGD